MFAVLLAALAIGEARADMIFVTILPGQIGEYTTAGAVVNAALVMGSFEGDFRSRHIEDTPISRVIFNKYKHKDVIFEENPLVLKIRKAFNTLIKKNVV